MRRIRLKVSYDGTAYCGSQLQPNGVTVEEKLNDAIRKLTGDASPVSFASRTDSGVHAAGNCAVFDTEMRMAADKFAFALNQRLPEDIRIQRSFETAPDWHPRKQNCRKTYEFRIFNSRIPDPLQRLYTVFYYYELDPEKMNRAIQCLVGEHDFAAFCSAGSQSDNTVRTIYSAEVLAEDAGGSGLFAAPAFSAPADAASEAAAAEAGAPDSAAQGRGSTGKKDTKAGYFPPKLVTIRISGSGFLYNMVRIIAGTLLQIGSGIREEGDLLRILRSRSRREAGPVAGGNGLCLKNIEFLPAREPVLSAENEDWSWEILQPPAEDLAKGPAAEPGNEAASDSGRAPGAAPAEEPAAYVSIRRAEKRDYESLVTRLLHQCYRNGARRIYVRDLEIPERLAPGQRYGYYMVRGLAEPETGGKAAPDLAESGGEMPEAAKQADFMETKQKKNPFYAVDT